MAFYDYICKDCEGIFEIEKGMNEAVRPNCPVCRSINTFRKFNVFMRGSSTSDTLIHEGTENSGSCSSCTSGLCSTCSTKGN